MIPDRVDCKHCDNRIYPDWRHHGSNMKPCYGGLDSEAEPRDSSSISTEQTFEEWLEQQWPDEEERSFEAHLHGSKMRMAWNAAKGKSNGR